MAVMIYALVTYHWRAAAIARRGSGPYDDRLGPVRPWLNGIEFGVLKTNLFFLLDYLVHCIAV